MKKITDFLKRVIKYLKRRLPKGSWYYDRAFTERPNLNWHYTKASYMEIWQAFDIPIDYKILDIGCGVGLFAHFLKDRGYKNYIGVDFSKVALEKARRRVPNFEFMRMNINSRKWKKFVKVLNPDIYVCFELLEHIKGDRELLKSLKQKEIIFSVPVFHHESHERFFLTKDDVYKRYGDLIDIKEYKFYKKFHLVKGVINPYT